MKTKLPLWMALLLGAASAGCQGFTLDIAGYEGAEITQNPQSIFVPGYGELIFETGVGSALVVNSAYLNDNGFSAQALGFDQDETLKIALASPEPVNLDFDFVGLSSGEGHTVRQVPFPHLALPVTFQGGADGAGLHANSWNAVPEPAAAALGLIGALLLVLRRRR
jgi:uncharacterized protein (TIGR03382 family)